MGYRTMLSAVFRFQLPELSSHPVLCDLLCSFRLVAPCRPLRPPAWDLAAVLTYLNSAVFEPLRVASAEFNEKGFVSSCSGYSQARGATSGSFPLCVVCSLCLLCPRICGQD